MLSLELPLLFLFFATDFDLNVIGCIGHKKVKKKLNDFFDLFCAI